MVLPILSLWVYPIIIIQKIQCGSFSGSCFVCDDGLEFVGFLQQTLLKKLLLFILFFSIYLIAKR